MVFGVYPTIKKTPFKTGKGVTEGWLQSSRGNDRHVLTNHGLLVCQISAIDGE